MKPRPGPKPKTLDPNQFAAAILEAVTGEPVGPPATEETGPAKDPAAVALGRKGGCQIRHANLATALRPDSSRSQIRHANLATNPILDRLPLFSEILHNSATTTSRRQNPCTLNSATTATTIRLGTIGRWT